MQQQRNNGWRVVSKVPAVFCVNESWDLSRHAICIMPAGGDVMSYANLAM
jgi:hypothetical protein